MHRDHHIHLQLPPDFPEGEVEITVRSAVGLNTPVAQQMQECIDDLNTLFARLDKLPPGGRSKEEIDRYIADERASWD